MPKNKNDKEIDIERYIKVGALSLLAVFNAVAVTSSSSRFVSDMQPDVDYSAQLEADMQGKSYVIEADGRDPLLVVEVNHNDIQEDRARAELTGEDTTDIISERFQATDLDEDLVSKTASKTEVFHYDFGGVMQDDSGVNNGEAAAIKIYEDNDAYERGEAASCVLNMPDEGATAAEWMAALQSHKIDEAGYEEIGFPDDYPEVFDDMFNDLVRYHEEAHCVNADEPQADYMATQHLSLKYGNSHGAELASFLSHVTDLREAVAGGKHVGMAEAIEAARADIVATGGYESDAAIRGDMARGEIPNFNQTDQAHNGHSHSHAKPPKPS